MLVLMRGEHQHLQWPFTGDIIIHCELVNLGKRQEPLLNYSIYDNFSCFFLSHSLLADRIRPMVDVFLVKRFLELYRRSAARLYRSVHVGAGRGCWE